MEDDLFQVDCYWPMRIPEAIVRDFDDGETRFLSVQKSWARRGDRRVWLWCIGTKSLGEAIRRVEAGLGGVDAGGCGWNGFR